MRNFIHGEPRRPASPIRSGSILLAVALAGSLLWPLAPARAQGNVFRCIDAEGKVVYQGQPCPGAGAGKGVESPPARAAAARSMAVPARAAKPQPRVVEPDSSKPEVARWGVDADVIVVSGYEFSAPITQVHITHSARPILLVLTSHQRTQWKVVPAPGTRLKGILVGSSDGASQVQAPPQVPVLADELPYAYDTANIRFRDLIAKLHARYGVERVLGFRGAYRLPELVPVSGPFLSDPSLTLAGIRPEVPKTRFDFDLVSTDGRRLPWSNTGPRDGKRYTGIVRAGNLTSQGFGGPAVVRKDSAEAYFLEGNGSTLVWAPNGLGGPRQKVDLPAHLPALSWASGIAWDTDKEVLAIVTFGGEGFFYRYDTRNKQWLGARSLQGRDLQGLALNEATGGYVAVSGRAELVIFNERGELEEVQPLQKLLPDLESTYDKGNRGPENLTVAASGDAVAVINVRNGTVTHIWTYEQGNRKAQLTYKVVE